MIRCNTHLMRERSTAKVCAMPEAAMADVVEESPDPISLFDALTKRLVHRMWPSLALTHARHAYL
jgi:hypothetical protein